MKMIYDALKTVYDPNSSGANFLVQMEARFSLMKVLSLNGGQNTLIVCSIAHHLSITMQQIEFNVLLDEFPTVTETKKAI